MADIAGNKLLLQKIMNQPTAQGVKEYINFIRAELKKIYESGTDGLELTKIHSDFLDSLLETLVLKATKGEEKIFSFPFALIAVGGYGRRELNPASDVDIIFLVNSGEEEKLNELILKTAYPLWDSGIDMSYSVRNINDCIDLALKNDEVLTSLLDARLVVGNMDEFKKFQRVLKDTCIKNYASIFERIVKMVEVRRKKNQHPERFIEPNLKEAEGGLRDYHTIRWLLFLKFGSPSVEALLRFRIISKGTFHKFLEAIRFLFIIRNELHFHYMRKHDDIDFESQKRIAVKMKFVDTKDELGVERFMRAFYMNTQVISNLLDDVLDEVFHYRYLKPEPVLSKPIHVESPFILDGTCIRVEKKNAFKSTANILKFFYLIARTGLGGDREIKKLLRTSLKQIGKNALKTSENFETFWSIFSAPFAYEAVREMYKSGVLFRLFPEFKKIYFKVQYDIYHVYPVDLHSLLVIQELDKLRSGEYVKEQPLLSFLIKEVKDISLLYFSALFHDIGKGYGSGHAKRGALIVERIMKRTKAREEQMRRASFLIMNHLKMSEIAQRRDLGDLKHIFDFSELVGDRENLKYLYILTFADLKAVSPHALTHWKSALLQELYIKTEEFLEKGRISENVLKDKIVKIQQDVRDALGKKYTREDVEAFIDVFPIRNFLTNSVEDIIRYFEILKYLEKEKYFISKDDYPDRRFSKVIFSAVDSPGIFSKITGVLSSNGINILSAQINTMRNGKILDVFYINDVVGEAVTDPIRWENTLKDLDDVMNGRIEVDALVSQRLKPSILKVKKRRDLPTRVIIDNHSSDLYTLIEVYTHDRPGVLYKITSTISSLSLNIYTAKISTKVDQVADVFYVSDLSGRKVLERKKIKHIRESLLNALSYNYGK